MTAGTPVFPDFRNPGVLLRVLFAVHALAFLTVLAGESNMAHWLAALYACLQLLEPALLLVLFMIGMLAPRLRGLAPWQGWLAVFVVADLAVVLVHWSLTQAHIQSVALPRAMWWATFATGLVGAWLHLLQQVRAPALAEARLMALTARIRPHFLFNSLNGILGIIRSDPRRAEKALEELAELFRALMQDPRELVPLSAEIALCRQYIELERLRLGERVRVSWDIEQCPPDALMPPLMLQPLLENAIYHGIEPASEPGEIEIRLLHGGSNIVIVMSNPHENAHAGSAGNHMALANIRERLMLFYDLAASIDVEVRDSRYTVRIVLPYQRSIA